MSSIIIIHSAMSRNDLPVQKVDLTAHVVVFKVTTWIAQLLPIKAAHPLKVFATFSLSLSSLRKRT